MIPRDLEQTINNIDINYDEDSVSSMREALSSLEHDMHGLPSETESYIDALYSYIVDLCPDDRKEEICNEMIRMFTGFRDRDHVVETFFRDGQVPYDAEKILKDFNYGLIKKTKTELTDSNGS